LHLVGSNLEILLCLLELFIFYLCGAGVKAVATRIGSCNSFLPAFCKIPFSNMTI